MFKEQSLTLEKIERLSQGFTILLNSEKLDGENTNIMPKKLGYKVASQAAELEPKMKLYTKRKQEAVESVEKKIEKKTFSNEREKNIQKAKMLNEELDGLAEVKETVKIITENIKESDLKDFTFPSAVFLYLGDLIDEIK